MLGMYRSGTFMLTRLLSGGYGYDLGKGKDNSKLIQSNSSNKKGHFELKLLGNRMMHFSGDRD